MAAQTIKRKIIDMLQRLPDDVGYERAIESIQAMQRLESGLEQATRGEWADPEGFIKELLSNDDEVPRHPQYPGVT